MNQLKKYVFIAEVKLNSAEEIGKLYKTSIRIVDGLSTELTMNNNGIPGTLSIESVDSDVTSISFRIFIESWSKMMLEDESKYIDILKSYLHSILLPEYEMTCKVIKLRIPSMLKKNNGDSYFTDDDGDTYKRSFNGVFRGVEGTLEPRSMDCESFFSDIFVNSYTYSSLQQEMHMMDSFRAEMVFDLFKAKAVEKNVTLTDIDSFDYETVFYDDYIASDDKKIR